MNGEIYPAPAKLNLHLRVTGRRADGYHLLQTVFRFIDFSDRLQFRMRDDGENGAFGSAHPLAGDLRQRDRTFLPGGQVGGEARVV